MAGQIWQPENYIYISHLEGEPVNERFKELGAPQFWRLPCYPETISDTMQSNFVPTNALGRTAPVYTYSNSGPRSVAVNLLIHRDMMDELNAGASNVILDDDDDYTESLIKALQSIALPKYNLNNKMIEPPLVALRLANEVFIKGVVNGAVGLNYRLPVITTLTGKDRYACVEIAFTISEVDPYDSSTVFKNGSFRGMVNTFRSTYDSNGNVTESRMGNW